MPDTESLVRERKVEQQIIFTEEMARVRAPEILDAVSVNIVGPTLIRFGTPAQKERLLPPIKCYLILGFVPGMPEVELDPDVVLVLFLPPLLYSAAFFADLHALRRDLRPILMSSIGLVLFTMCAVAYVVARHGQCRVTAAHAERQRSDLHSDYS